MQEKNLVLSESNDCIVKCILGESLKNLMMMYHNFMWCLTVSLSLSHSYPGSGVVLDCIDS